MSITPHRYNESSAAVSERTLNKTSEGTPMGPEIRSDWRRRFGVLALLTAYVGLIGCTEVARSPEYSQVSAPPPVPKISIGEFAEYAAPGLPPNASQMLADALREHLRQRDLLWTDASNPRIDLTGMLQAYEGRYGNPPDDSLVVDVTGELRDGGKLLTSAAVNRHVGPQSDWAREMAALAESLIDQLMQRVAPPPAVSSYSNADYGYAPTYGNVYSAYPYYYPGGGYYGYSVPPYGYYYGGPSYWWPYYYWGWGGRSHDHDHDHGYGGRPGGGGGSGFHRPPPPVPPAVFDSAPRTHPQPGSGAGLGSSPTAPTTSGFSGGGRRPSGGMGGGTGQQRPGATGFNRPPVPPAVFEAPRSHGGDSPRPAMIPSPAPSPTAAPEFNPPPTAPALESPRPTYRGSPLPSGFNRPSAVMDAPRSHGFSPRPQMSAPAPMYAPDFSSPSAPARSFNPPSVPAFNRSPSSAPAVRSAPPPAFFSAPSSSGGGGGMQRRRGR